MSGADTLYNTLLSIAKQAWLIHVYTNKHNHRSRHFPSPSLDFCPFCRFDNKDSACKGIVEVNGTEVGGYIVRCSWGKESNDSNNSSSPNYTQQVSIDRIARQFEVMKLNT